jgi:hypothetical protein
LDSFYVSWTRIQGARSIAPAMQDVKQSPTKLPKPATGPARSDNSRFELPMSPADEQFVDTVRQARPKSAHIADGWWLREDAEFKFANGNLVSTSISLKNKSQFEK